MLFLGYSVGLEAEERRDTRLFPDRTRRKLSGHFDLYSSVIHVIILHFHSDFFLNLLLNTDHCYFARGEIPSRERNANLNSLIQVFTFLSGKSFSCDILYIVHSGVRF